MNFTFYKETDFKETQIGKIPSEWEVKKLVEVVNYVKGRKPKKLHDRKESELFLPYLTAEYMRGLEEPKWCNPQEDRKLVRVKEGDVIMIWDGSYAGHVFTGFKGILASTMIKIVPNQEANEKFLYYFLAKSFQIFRETSTGTGVPHVNRKMFDELLIPIPSLKEQQKIAEILSTVDEAIQKTNEIIAKTERLKKGLKQELLTKGIGHKEFKDTEIGRIPKEWEIVKLGDVLELCQYGLSIPLKEKGKYPIVRMDEIVNGYVTPNVAKYVDLDEETFEKFKLEKGDILFNRTNAPDLVGRTGIFLLEGDYVFASYLIRLRVKHEIFDPHFLTFYLIFSEERLKQLATRAVHQANINATNLKKLRIPRPAIEEQRKIAEILSAVGKKFEVERNEKEKLEKIKQGLMNLLLTGKIRVR